MVNIPKEEETAPLEKYIEDSKPPKTISHQNDARPGQMGEAVQLPENIPEDFMKSIEKDNQRYGFHKYRSDLIGYYRVLPDHRNEWCKIPKRFPKDLPSTSIIIPVFNEAWSTLIRTVNSVIINSPPKLIHEIILVVDFTILSHLKTQLEDHFKNLQHSDSQEIATPPKVKIIRTKKREGLIRAKNIGAQHATGEVLTFLDSHCECTKGWLQPLLERIAKNSTAVALPIVDVVNNNTFAYHPSALMGVGFSWELSFKLISIPPREVLRRSHEAEPFFSPVMLGGIFSISRTFFEKLGGYDGGLKFWGGENLEISFKAWMCGGSIEVVPCSRVGHVFRNRNFPYHSSYRSVQMNLGRIAKVWMDEYVEYFYERVDKMNVGDVSSQKALRDMLKCRSFDWYLRNVYPEMNIPKECPAYGEIKNEWEGIKKDSVKEDSIKKDSIKKYSLCLDSLQGRNSLAGLFPCHGDRGNQYWLLTKVGEIRQYDSCLDYAGQGLYLRECHGLKGNQYWKYSQKTKLLVHEASGFCVAVGEDWRLPVMKRCDSEAAKQLWILENYDPSKEV